MARRQPARAPREGRRPLIAGNWKMNTTHLEAIALLQKLVFSLTEDELDAAEVVVLPPFTALRSVQTLVAGDRLAVGYGAQDLSVHDSGAYTGEVSGAMLAALACGFVVVGHSERRSLHGEDDATVAAKARAALRHGVVPIVCVGEGLEVRRAGYTPVVRSDIAVGVARPAEVLVEMEQRLIQVSRLFDMTGATDHMVLRANTSNGTFDPNATTCDAEGRQALADEIFTVAKAPVA